MSDVKSLKTFADGTKEVPVPKFVKNNDGYKPYLCINGHVTWHVSRPATDETKHKVCDHCGKDLEKRIEEYVERPVNGGHACDFDFHGPRIKGCECYE